MGQKQVLVTESCPLLGGFEVVLGTAVGVSSSTSSLPPLSLNRRSPRGWRVCHMK